MRTKVFRLFQGVFALALVFLFTSVGNATEVPRMTKEALKQKLEDKGLVIIDVRTGKDWKSSEFKVVGAVQQDSGNIESWADSYPKDNVLVLYCA